MQRANGWHLQIGLGKASTASDRCCQSEEKHCKRWTNDLTLQRQLPMTWSMDCISTLQSVFGGAGCTTSHGYATQDPSAGKRVQSHRNTLPRMHFYIQDECRLQRKRTSFPQTFICFISSNICSGGRLATALLMDSGASSGLTGSP